MNNSRLNIHTDIPYQSSNIEQIEEPSPILYRESTGYINPMSLFYVGKKQEEWCEKPINNKSKLKK